MALIETPLRPVARTDLRQAATSLVCCCAVLGIVTGCGVDGTTASTTEVPLYVGSAPIEGRATDLGYTIELTSARIVVRDVLLKDGSDEQQVAWLRQGFQSLSDALIPSAHAHPGHGAGGTVVGELLGTRVVEFVADDESSIGAADAVVSDVTGVDFLLVAGTVDDGLDADDPLLGHYAHFVGEAVRDDVRIPFDALLQLDEETALAGAPALPNLFELEAEQSAPLFLRFTIDDPFEDDQFFDGVDFAALSGDGTREIRPGSDAHNRLRRGLSSHDYYAVTPAQETSLATAQ